MEIFCRLFKTFLLVFIVPCPVLSGSEKTPTRPHPTKRATDRWFINFPPFVFRRPGPLIQLPRRFPPKGPFLGHRPPPLKRPHKAPPIHFEESHDDFHLDPHFDDPPFNDVLPPHLDEPHHIDGQPPHGPPHPEDGFDPHLHDDFPPIHANLISDDNIYRDDVPFKETTNPRDTIRPDLLPGGIKGIDPEYAAFVSNKLRPFTHPHGRLLPFRFRDFF